VSQYATLTIQFRGKVRSERAAAELAQGAAEHLLETFNDDGSLDEVFHRADGTTPRIEQYVALADAVTAYLADRAEAGCTADSVAVKAMRAALAEVQP
jgi:hypothetical protein